MWTEVEAKASEEFKESVKYLFQQIPLLVREAKDGNTSNTDPQRKIKITVTIKFSKPPEFGVSVEW